MSVLWIIPPLLEEPSAELLAAHSNGELYARADHLARVHTGAELTRVATAQAHADWARARLRGLCACLIEARVRLSAGAVPLAVVGIGLGEIGALALAGLLRDEDALRAMLSTALALEHATPGLSVIAHGAAHLSASALELSYLSDETVLAEGALSDVAAWLSKLYAAGARVEQPRPGPVFAAARARASEAALAAATPAAPSAIGLLRTDSTQLERTLPRQLSPWPVDLRNVWRHATQLGCKRWEVIGESLDVQPPKGSVAKPAASQTRGYYIGDVREQSASSFVSERVLSLELEPYLITAARLNKTSVLPGSFELEIGVEAGKLLHPELVPVSIDNALFHSALKLFEAQPVTMRLKARSQPLSDGRHSVTLSITSDLVHKSGRVLQSDRKHCDLTVVMGPVYDTPPMLLPFSDAEAQPDPDVPGVLYQSGSPLWLGRYFEAVWDTRRAGNIVRSVYRNPADLSLAAFGEHLGAPCLMDAVLQNPLRQRGPYLAVGIPDNIRKVRFFGLLNEREICARHGHLILTSLVDDDLPYCELMQVSTPDGRVLMEVERFALIPLGFIDRRDLSVHAEVPAAMMAAT